MFETNVHTQPSLTTDQIKEESNRFHALTMEIAKVIVGQRDVIKFIVNAILCNGHILLEGVPGVAKTTMIKAVAKALNLSFNRVQFTPDLLPSDVIGTLIYNPKTQEFETKKGPIFAHLVLADEINRAPAKVQAALLESMAEHQVTIGSHTFPMAKPFLVFATQNPIEQEGTYRLPEAQVDRFMFKIMVDYPDMQQEREIISRNLDTNDIKPVLTQEELFHAQKLVSQVYIDDKIIDYIVNIVFATRDPKKYKINDIASYIQYGVSPRATLALHAASRAHAFLEGRHFVIPDDVKAVAPTILRHRIGTTFEAEADNVHPDVIVRSIVNTLPTP